MKLIAASILASQALSYDIVNDSRASLQFLRVRRKNSGFFEETRSGNYARECREEMCSLEELSEIYDGDKTKTLNIDGGEYTQSGAWQRLTKRCYVDKCDAKGTKVCIQKWNERTCVCNPGYDGKACEDDIDECAFTGEAAVCTGAHEKCLNVDGGFSCACENFYKMDEGVCVWDSTTCADNPCGANMGCSDNSDSGFTCDCLLGFSEETTGNCVDIDECADMTDDCTVSTPNSHCSNTIGSYVCLCDTGFESTETGCQEIPKCRNVECHENSVCDVLDGSCVCNAGFFGVDSCDDIDECANGLFNMNQEAACPEIEGIIFVCRNTVGSFECDAQEIIAPEGQDNGSGIVETTEAATTEAVKTMAVTTEAALETTEEATPEPETVPAVEGRCSVDVDECQVNNGGCEGMCMNYFCHHQCYETIPEEANMCHHFATIELASEDNDMRGYSCGCYEPYELCVDQFSCVPRNGASFVENNSSGCEDEQISVDGKCYSVSSGKASYGGALEACAADGGALVNVQSRKVWWILGSAVDGGMASFWVDSASDADMNLFGEGDGRLANPANDMSNVPPQMDNVDGSEEHMFVCEF